MFPIVGPINQGEPSNAQGKSRTMIDRSIIRVGLFLGF